jgi:membrane-associated phospholipid phosphatase
MREVGASRVAGSLALVSGFAVIAAAATYWLTVTTRAGQLMGELMLGGRPASPDQVAGAERVLASLSLATLVLGTGGIVLIGAFQGRPRLALAAGGTVVAAAISSQVLKSLVLDRADLLGGLFYPLPNSFPSGHATIAASVGVALVLVVPPLLRGPTIFFSAVLASVVAVSTMIAGWHRMADAVGGVFVATAWGAGLAAILAWRRGVERVGRRTAAISRASSVLPLVAGSVVGCLAALGYILAVADPLDVLGYLAKRGGSPALFGLGAALTSAATLIVLGILGLVIRDVRLDPHPADRPRRPIDRAGAGAPVATAAPGPDDEGSRLDESAESASTRASSPPARSHAEDA